MKKIIAIVAFLSVICAFNITYSTSKVNYTTHNITSNYIQNNTTRFTTETHKNNFDSMKSGSSTVPTRVAVDEINGDNIIRDTLYVRGWAISSQGVKNITLYIDNKKVGVTVVGSPRPDVNAIMNKSGNYKDADKSGYSITIPKEELTGLSYGEHTLKVTAVGNDETYVAQTYTIEKKAPQVCLDYINPQKNNYVMDKLTLSGWAVNQTDVKSVDIFIDNKSIAQTPVGVSRPDVNKIINSSGVYKNADKSGYKITIPFESLKDLSVGNHTLKIVAVGYDGSTATTTKTITKAGSQTCIDHPSKNQNLTDSIYVSGWAVSSTGIKEIKVYVDDKLIKTFAPNVKRPDVNKIINYKSSYYNAENSGYSLYINKSDFTAKSSKHSVKVVGVSNDGTTKENSTTVETAPTNTCVDAIGTNGYITDKLYLKGWSVSGSGVKQIDVYINDKYIDTIPVNVSRPDVDKIINTSKVYYKANESGFKSYISGDKLKEIKYGKSTLKLTSVSNDGTASTYTTSVYKAAPEITKDGPGGSSFYIHENSVIRGWAINASGIEKVQLFVDGKYICDATTGLSRPDVNAARNTKGIYAGASNSGFSAKITKNMMEKIPYGSQKFTIIAVGKDGVVDYNNYTVEKAKPQICVDYSYIDDNSYRLKGWSVGVEGLKDVLVYINDRPYIADEMSTRKIAYSRPDVDKIINHDGRYSNAENSGFYIEIPRDKIPNAAKFSVKVVAVGGDNVKVSNTAFAKTPERTFDYYNISLNEMLPRVQAQPYQSKVTMDNIDPKKIIANKKSGIYQFMNLKYWGGVTTAQMNTMLSGRGVLNGQGQAFIDAGNAYHINPVYLAAHARIESGNGTSKLSTGQKGTDGRTYYNQFGIGAVDNNPIVGGTNYAKNNGWDSVYKSIVGGGKWISDRYINGGKPDQDTLYEMRFNPEYYEGKWSKPFNYASDPNWAGGIAEIMYDYRNLLSGMDVRFDFPQYK